MKSSSTNLHEKFNPDVNLRANLISIDSKPGMPRVVPMGIESNDASPMSNNGVGNRNVRTNFTGNFG